MFSDVQCSAYGKQITNSDISRFVVQTTFIHKCFLLIVPRKKFIMIIIIDV